MAVDVFDSWFDPIETAVRARAREFIEELIRGELDTVLGRPSCGRSQMADNEESTDVRTKRAPAFIFKNREDFDTEQRRKAEQNRAILQRK